MKLYYINKRGDGKLELKSCEGDGRKREGFADTKEGAFKSYQDTLSRNEAYHKKDLEKIKTDRKNSDVLRRRELGE